MIELAGDGQTPQCAVLTCCKEVKVRTKYIIYIDAPIFTAVISPRMVLRDNTQYTRSKMMVLITSLNMGFPRISRQAR